MILQTLITSVLAIGLGFIAKKLLQKPKRARVRVKKKQFPYHKK